MTTTTAATLELSTSARERSGAGAKRWTGRVLSGLAILFLGIDAAGKLLELRPVMAACAELGYPPNSVFAIGLVLLVGVVAYAIPRTAPIGAVLITGFLGGAIATNVRAENPLWSHTLFPIYVAVFVWGGLFLRDARVRGLLSPRAEGGAWPRGVG
jgi:hypothetical protein